jgi:hypothetical protein
MLSPKFQSLGPIVCFQGLSVIGVLVTPWMGPSDNAKDVFLPFLLGFWLSHVDKDPDVLGRRTQNVCFFLCLLLEVSKTQHDRCGSLLAIKQLVFVFTERTGDDGSGWKSSQ